MQDRFETPRNTAIQATCATSEKVDKNESLRHQARYLGAYLTPHRRVLAISLALSGISTAFGMIQPYFAKILIDRVFLESRAELLLPVLGTLIGLLLISFATRVINSYIYTRYSATILFRMREDLFRHLQKIPLTFFSKRKIGDIFSRIASDMADIQGLVTDLLPRVIFDTLTCGVTGAILFWLNWKMALMSLCILPFALILLQKLKPRLMKLSTDVAENNADISHFLFESLANTGAIRAFGAQRTESGKLRDLHGKTLDYLLRYKILGAVSGSVPTAFSVVNTLIVFGFGGLQVLGGDLTIGSLVAFSVYQARVFGPLQGLMEAFLAVQKSKVALRRVREILDIPVSPDEAGTETLTPEAMKEDIRVKDLSFSYDGEAPVLSNLSFTIPAGMTTAITGRSGAGKTTLCHLLCRLLSPGTGDITWAGRKFRDLDPRWFRMQVALVSQETFLFHTSILENIRFFRPDATFAEVREAAKAAEIDDTITSLPNGYETLIGDRGTRLSGGQRQRISIARAILAKPAVLILDEATAFLDAGVETKIRKTLKTLMAGRTTIVISHRRSAVEDAHQTVCLDDGTVTCQASEARLSA